MGKSVTLAAVFAITTALATSPLSAQDAPKPATVPEGGASAIAASVNGTEITLGHMIALRANLPPQYQALPDDLLFKGILDQLVQQAALAQSMDGKTTLRDELALENDKRGYLSGVALQAVAGTAVTDQALQKAYDAKFADAAETKEYNAAHILVETEEEAKDIKTKSDDGADFADLAKEYSSDGASANGGDLGWFSDGMMVQPFQDAVFGMDVGAISDPVESQFGWHLIQLKETRIKSAPTLDDMREELATEIEQAAVEAHIKSITDTAKIERPGEGFDPAVLRDETLLEK